MKTKLKALKTDEKNYEGLVEGVFPSSFMRTQENLILKIGAQIMTVINDPGRVPCDDGADQFTLKNISMEKYEPFWNYTKIIL